MADYRLVPVEPTPEMIEAGGMTLAIRWADNTIPLIRQSDHLRAVTKMTARIAELEAELASGVLLPLRTREDGCDYELCSYHFQSEGGTSVLYFHVMDDGHAEQIRQEIKATVEVAGRMVEVEL
ncbi:MAG: hypothetical protein QNL70_03565 [Pseudomonas sp.]